MRPHSRKSYKKLRILGMLERKLVSLKLMDELKGENEDGNEKCSWEEAIEIL
jgi:hypothetical protein